MAKKLTQPTPKPPMVQVPVDPTDPFNRNYREVPAGTAPVPQDGPAADDSTDPPQDVQEDAVEES